MAQFIRTPCDLNVINFNQVSQISYLNGRIIEIFYDVDRQRVAVQNNNDYFWLTSPDINHLTINHVLIALGIAGEQIVITWAENNQLDNVLNSIVQHASLNQISIYPRNHNLQNHNLQINNLQNHNLQNHNLQNHNN